MKVQRTTALYLIVFALTGCGDNEEMLALKSRMNKLEQINEKLSQEVAALNDKAGPNADDFSAYLQKGDEGYSKIRFDLGTLLASIGQIRAHPRGTEILLNIGNLTAANFTRIKADIQWGVLDRDGHPDNKETNLREIEINQYVQAGAWTTTSVIIEGVNPDLVDFIRLKGIVHRGVALVHKGAA